MHQDVPWASGHIEEGYGYSVFLIWPDLQPGTKTKGISAVRKRAADPVVSRVTCLTVELQLYPVFAHSFRSCPAKTRSLQTHGQVETEVIMKPGTIFNEENTFDYAIEYSPFDIRLALNNERSCKVCPMCLLTLLTIDRRVEGNIKPLGTQIM